MHPVVRELKAATASVPSSWVRRFAADNVVVGLQYPTASRISQLKAACELAGYDCDVWPHEGTSGWGTMRVTKVS